MAERRYLRYRIPTQQSCKTVVMSFSFLTYNLTDDSPVFKLRFTLHFVTFITLHYSERSELVRYCSCHENTDKIYIFELTYYVLFIIYNRYTNGGVSFHDFPKIPTFFRRFPKTRFRSRKSEDISIIHQRI